MATTLGFDLSGLTERFRTLRKFPILVRLSSLLTFVQDPTASRNQSLQTHMYIYHA